MLYTIVHSSNYFIFNFLVHECGKLFILKSEFKNMPKKKAILPMSSFESTITFQGVKTHNLQNIDIEIPKNQLITITGVSGSGKSSFAFDTIYKEGQYRIGYENGQKFCRTCQRYFVTDSFRCSCCNQVLRQSKRHHKCIVS